MLLTLRIPVVDLRPFCRPDYPQGVRFPATWSEDKEFVRHFGPVIKRPRGPMNPWISERAFCQYDRALRFPPSYQSLLTADVPEFAFFRVMRRLYPATTLNDLFHVDVQLASRPRRFSSDWEAVRQYRLAEADLVSMVNAVLSLPTTVLSAPNSPAKQPLGKSGPSLASALDTATTTMRPSGRVVAGAPAIALEVEREELVSTRWAGLWEIDDGLRLSARAVVFGGRTVNVFVVGRRLRRIDRNRSRALRIHLLRLHSEREYLRRIGRLLANDGFLEGCSQAQIERIQNALNQSLATLTRARSNGFSTPELTAAFIADRTISGSELEVLTQRVQVFRPIIGTRLRRLQELEDTAAAKWREFLEQNPDGKNYIYISEAHMSHYDQRGSQIGAVGDNASATNFSFGGQLNVQAMPATDVEALQSALRTLRKRLADQLLTDSVIDVDSEEVSATQIGNAIGALSEAEEAISVKDNQRVLGALRRSGRWLAAFAQEVGIDVAAAAIRAALHLP